MSDQEKDWGVKMMNTLMIGFAVVFMAVGAAGGVLILTNFSSTSVAFIAAGAWGFTFAYIGGFIVSPYAAAWVVIKMGWEPPWEPPLEAEEE